MMKMKMKNFAELNRIEIRKAFANGELSNEEICYICTKLCRMGILKNDGKIECTHICCPYGFWDVADMD